MILAPNTAEVEAAILFTLKKKTTQLPRVIPCNICQDKKLCYTSSLDIFPLRADSSFVVIQHANYFVISFVFT